MPNLLTHSLLVKRFYIKVEAEDKGGERTFIQGNYDLLSLGSQGPDPLFYFGVVPFKFHLFTAKKRLGNKLHADDGKRFFKLLLDRSYGIDDIVSQRRFRSFIFRILSSGLQKIKSEKQNRKESKRKGNFNLIQDQIKVPLTKWK